MGSKTSKSTHTPQTFPSISSRYTSDDSKFLWMKGKSELSIIGLKKMSNFTVNMWDFEDKKRKTKGLFAVSSRNGKKLFGVSTDMNQTFVLIFVKIRSARAPSKNSTKTKALKSRSRQSKNDVTIEKHCIQSKAFKDQITLWFCAEVSVNEKFIYIGGAYKDTAVIGVMRFNKSLKPIHFSKLSIGEFKGITTIQRVPSTEILLAGAWCSIIALTYNHKQGKFKILNIFQNLMQHSQIIRMAFTGRILYFIGDKSDELGVIEFYKKIDMHEMIRRENNTKSGKKAQLMDNLIKKMEEKQENEKDSLEKSDLQDVFGKEKGLVKRLNTMNINNIELPIDGILCIDINSERTMILVCHKKGVDMFLITEKGFISSECQTNLTSEFFLSFFGDGGFFGIQFESGRFFRLGFLV